MLPDRVTALCERSGHVIHVHLKGQDWLINTGKLAQWRAITQPYLQSQGVNRLHDLIFCDAHAREAIDQAKSEFHVDNVFSSETILVHLGQFRVLILPDLTEQTLANLECDHADVVYCAHLPARRFPRRLDRRQIVAQCSRSERHQSGNHREFLGRSNQPKVLLPETRTGP